MASLDDFVDNLSAALAADKHPEVSKTTLIGGTTVEKRSILEVAQAMTIIKNQANLAEKETNGLVSLIERDFS